MDLLHKLSLAGGLFALLTFIHFFVDWICQTHAEAMAKHNNPKVRARHCLIYTAGFVPFMWALGFSWWAWLISLNILFWSHFVEDTYFPVFLWAKYIRKPNEMLPPHDPRQGFMEFVQTPLGKILLISIDQILHLLILFVLSIIIVMSKI